MLFTQNFRKITAIHVYGLPKMLHEKVQFVQASKDRMRSRKENCVSNLRAKILLPIRTEKSRTKQTWHLFQSTRSSREPAAIEKLMFMPLVSYLIK